MKSISSRVQLGLVALGYAAVLVVAATLLYERHLRELNYPAEASGGMCAAGDAFLHFFIASLFMTATEIWLNSYVTEILGFKGAIESVNEYRTSRVLDTLLATTPGGDRCPKT